MEREEPWAVDLRRDLGKIGEHYTTDKFPASPDTQRQYQQHLAELEQRYSQRMDDYFAGERRGYDEKFGHDLRTRLHNAEAEALKDIRSDHGKAAYREGMRGELQAIEAKEYRQSDGYKDGMQDLVERQASDRERVDKAVRHVERSLDERFGLTHGNEGQETSKGQRLLDQFGSPTMRKRDDGRPHGHEMG